MNFYSLDQDLLLLVAEAVATQVQQEYHEQHPPQRFSAPPLFVLLHERLLIAGNVNARVTQVVFPLPAVALGPLMEEEQTRGSSF
jgi:hypothetical protein